MTKTSHSTVRIIDSLAEITRHHDRNIIEKSLLKTLSDLIAGSTRLYRVIQTEDNTDFSLLAFAENGLIDSLAKSEQIPAPKTDALEEVLDTGYMVSIPCAAVESSNDSPVFDNIYPTFDGDDEIFAILIHRGERPNASEERLVQGILKVYANYLILIEKTKRDKLTGLFNRESLNHELNKVLFSSHGSPLHSNIPDNRRAENSGLAFIALIDIDHFKSVNDHYGHLFGDEILIIISRLLAETFSRQDDMVFRYGGEEFVTIVNTTNREGASQIFERLRQKIEGFDFPQIERLTISIGYSIVKQQQTAADLLGEADQALYYAKENGRNVIHCYEDLVVQGLVASKENIHYGEVKLF